MVGQSIVTRCISLVGSPRRERMAEQLDATGLDWAFFDACTSPPKDLPYDADRARTAYGRPLGSGELGCFASHWELWKQVTAPHGPEMMIVLEDDVLLEPLFFAQVDRLAQAARRYGYLRLCATVPAGLRVEEEFLDRYVARFSGRAYGTQGYLITREVAHRWLSSIREVVRPVDDEIDRYWAHGVPIRAVFPFPVVGVFPILGVDHGVGIKRSSAEPLPKVEWLRWTASRAMEKYRRHLADIRSRVAS